MANSPFGRSIWLLWTSLACASAVRVPAKPTRAVVASRGAVDPAGLARCRSPSFPSLAHPRTPRTRTCATLAHSHGPQTLTALLPTPSHVVSDSLDTPASPHPPALSLPPFATLARLARTRTLFLRPIRTDNVSRAVPAGGGVVERLVPPRALPPPSVTRGEAVRAIRAGSRRIGAGKDAGMGGHALRASHGARCRRGVTGRRRVVIEQRSLASVSLVLQSTPDTLTT